MRWKYFTAPSVWYLAQTKPRQEEIALVNLERQGYLVKLPRVTSLRRPSKRAVRLPPGPKTPQATQVLFPGYIFFAPKHSEQSIAPVRSTLGVTRVVRFGLEPARISDRLLEEVLAFVDQTERSPGGLLAHLGQIVEGTAVLVRDGPFSGLSGLVSRVGSQRVMVLLEIMGKAQTLGFDLGQLDRA
jgi:transcriptional antiterminator RfaH